MMATANVRTAIQVLKGRIGGSAVALVSRGGQVMAAELPPEVSAETFSIMCATIYGAAVTANAELGRAPPERIAIPGNDAITMIVRSGSRAVLVGVVDPGSDLLEVERELAKFADLLQLNG